jgi:hypothetical protein
MSNPRSAVSSVDTTTSADKNSKAGHFLSSIILNVAGISPTSAGGDGTGEHAHGGIDSSESVDNMPSSRKPVFSPVTGDTTCSDEHKKNEEETDDEPAKATKKLYKSHRFKGYLTILLASVINYHAVEVSQDANDISAVTPSSQQVAYGLCVSLISCIVCGFCVLVHLDNYSYFTKFWKDNLFAPKSKFEIILDLFLLMWWFIATCIQTG